MNVLNMMEEVVKSCLKEMVSAQPALQQCDDKILSDIAAIALNHLPPKYVATTKGEVFAKTQLRAQVETDVYRELALAAEKVLQSPNYSSFTRE